MYLKKLSVLNFKNHSDSRLDFKPNINCFVGDNGSGKTNLLDAIHYLSFTKSFFVKQDSINVLHEQVFMTIEGVFEKDDKTELVQCAFKTGEKKVVKRNKKKYDKLAEHIGLFPIVMVSPTDNELLLSGSDVRRKYMDSVISQFNKQYLNTLIAYNKLILQRNALLKSSDSNIANLSNLSLYDEQIAPLAHIIFEKRKLFLNKLAPIFINYYKSISNTREQVTIHYDSQLSDKNFLDLCQQNSEKDRLVKFTSVGVHKDDLIFQLNGHPIKRVGSQGQQKTYLLALKLAQFDFMKEVLSYKPMLLLDDVFDKLDDNRVEQLMRLVDQHHFGQIFVTDTHPNRCKQIFNKINADYKLFHINNGAIEKEE